MGTKRTDVVSASEIASWAWCPESWRLDQLGRESENQEALARGRWFHARTSAFEAWSRRVLTLGRWLILLALLVAAVWYAFSRGVGR